MSSSSAPGFTTTIIGPRTPHEKAHEKKNEVDQNIQVFVRCRPLDTSRKEKAMANLQIDKIRKEVRIPEKDSSRSGPKVFTFDQVFDASVGQCEVYHEVVAPLVQEVLAGYNCTVFAYGQTGTGKTYTMEGCRSDFECSWEEDPKAGIIPRALDQLFELLSETPGDHSVSVSYMELYNENLYDLLSPNEELVKLNIYEDNIQKGKVKVGGLSEITVQQKDEIYDVLQKGSAKRQTAATKLNACSSRSHAIFAVTVRMKDIDRMMDGEEVYRIGKLNLVDLAGSENIGRSGAVDKRAAEAGNINKSLLTLGRVITSLVDKSSHIPYRESKLTRLLQDSLGGKTKTSIIATFSPSISDHDDTFSTLDYAQRAKKITNKPECNQKLSKITVLKEMTAEIERLRRDLSAVRGGADAYYISKDNYDAMSEQIKELEDKDKEAQARLKELEEELERIKVLFGETSAELGRKEEQLKETRETLVKTETDLTETKEVLTVVKQEKKEQEHLVDVHVKTEKKLSKQAKTLLSVANTSTNHVDRLHDKVSRVKDVEEENLKILNQFLEGDKDKARMLLDVIEEGSTDFLKNLESELISKVSQIQESITTSQNKIPITVKELTSMITMIQEGIHKKRQEVNGVLEEAVSTAKKHVSVIQKTGEKQKEILETQTHKTLSSLNAIHSYASDSHSQTETFLMKVNESLVNLKATRNQQVTEAKKEIQSHLESNQEDLTSLLNQMNELEATQSSLRSKQDEVMKLFDSLRVESEKVTREMEGVRKKLKTMLQSSLPSQSQRMDEVVSTASSTLEVQENALNEITNEFDRQAAASFQRINDAVRGTEEDVQSSGQVLQDSVTSTCAQIEEGIELNASFLQSQVTKQVDDAFNQELDQQEKLSIFMNEQMSSVATSIEVSTGLTGDFKGSLPRNFLPVRLQWRQTMASLKEGVEERSAAVETLVTSQVKKTISSGQTPQKTCFIFPNELVQTSPHDRILSRFRSRKEKQDFNGSNNDLPVVSESEEELEEELSRISLQNQLNIMAEDSSRPSSADSAVENKEIKSKLPSKSKVPKLDRSFSGLGKNAENEVKNSLRDSVSSVLKEQSSN